MTSSDRNIPVLVAPDDSSPKSVLIHAHQKDVRDVSRIPGMRWLKSKNAFRAPRDLQTMKLIRKDYGERAKFHPEIIAWAREVQKVEQEVRAIQMMDDAELVHFPELNEEIYSLMRPDQRIGTKFLSTAPSPLIADEPGLGKTWQVIASQVEDGSYLKPNLIICPKISINSVWLTELNRLLGDPLVYVAPEGRKNREAMFAEMMECHDLDVPFYLVVNWNMLTLRNDEFQFEEFGQIPWANVVVDEAHLTGLANPSTQTARGLMKVEGDKRVAMTGTPMGGKPMRLWGILHWLNRKEFGNSHQWGERWIDKTELDLQGQGRKVTKWKGVRKHKEEEFARAHSPYILRRTKAEVIVGRIPPTQREIWLDMSTEQAKQYKEMDEEAYIALEEQEEEVGRVNMTSVFATYAWLKQFADGYCDLEYVGDKVDDITGEAVPKFRAVPTRDSPKLSALWDICQELDMHEGSGEKMVVYSQFRRWADEIYDFLTEKGLRCARITGGVKQEERDRVQEVFQRQEDTEIQVVVCTTKAAGVSINLDAADNATFFDETWDPDEQQQAMDRIDRASRNHVITIRWLRTRGTVEEDVKKTNNSKRRINDVLLDKYRLSKEEHNE